MNYIELHEKYMKLQSTPLSKMTIKERNDLQIVLEQLIDNSNSTEYDLRNYFVPKYNMYESEIEQIKQYISEQIIQQEAIISIAQIKINKYKNKLKI